MNAASRSLERRAMSLGTAFALDYGLQFLLPVVLTRALDPHSFGEYRLLWLGVSTLLMITPMCMPQTLYYFLPRSDSEKQRLYLNQCLIFMAFAALVAAWALSPFDPFLPQSMQGLVAHNTAAVMLIAGLWIFSWVLDILPTVDERVDWQARVIVSLSALRAVLLSGVALVTRDLGAVLWALAGLTALKAGILLFYVRRHHGLRGPWLSREPFKEQVKHAAPFGLSGMLHGMRSQGDQWVAAALFSVAQFASFSVATVLGPVVQMCRQSVNHVFLPSMSRMHSSGDVRSMLALNSRANAMVALLVYPLLAFAFVFAVPLITLVYTAAYVEAVPVLRIYVFGLLILVVEIQSVLFLMKQGPFAAWVNGLVLALALPLSYFGAVTWGLPGAALGSVVALYSERAVSLSKLARLSDTPLLKLQDWGTLAGILAAAALSAAIAGVVVGLTSLAAFMQLACGAAVVAVAYPAALFLTGQRRCLTSFLASLRRNGPEPATAIE
jgi:O-antigen/teichoic acid export membrane protein